VIARTHETGQVLPHRKESRGPPMTARTFENEEAILNTVKEDGTRSLAEIARPLGISSCSVSLHSCTTSTARGLPY
jgi:hypothetical protein